MIRMKQQGKTCTWTAFQMLETGAILERKETIHLQEMQDALAGVGLGFVCYDALPVIGGEGLLWDYARCSDRVVETIKLYMGLLYIVPPTGDRHMMAFSRGDIIDPRTGSEVEMPRFVQQLFVLGELL